MADPAEDHRVRQDQIKDHLAAAEDYERAYENASTIAVAASMIARAANERTKAICLHLGLRLDDEEGSEDGQRPD